MGAEVGPYNAPTQGAFADLNRGRNGVVLRRLSIPNENHRRQIVSRREEEAAWRVHWSDAVAETLSTCS